MDKLCGVCVLHGVASGVNDTHPAPVWGTDTGRESLGVTSCCRQKLPPANEAVVHVPACAALYSNSN